MTRGIITGGRPTEIFPETAKELGRRVGLTETVFLLKAVEKDDGGGSYEYDYERHAEPIRARIDSYKRAKPRGVVGGQINEFADHVITLDVTVELEAPDRLERKQDEAIYEVLTVTKRTDEATIMVLVKEL